MTKNTHMTHLEDLVIDGGLIGAQQAIAHLNNLRDSLSFGSTTISAKWDGAPAIFAGIDPTDGQFFVAKKGIFNKSPKVYKTDADIDADTDGELSKKLKLALRHLPKLGIKGVVQGDFLYDREDIKEVQIDGVPHFTFHPNTIVYAVPKESDIAQKILSSEIGVVWHTEYRGVDFESMSASFGKEIASEFQETQEVFSIDAAFKAENCLTKIDAKKIDNLVSRALFFSENISRITFDNISSGELNARLNVFINETVRAGKKISGEDFREELQKSLKAFFDKEADKRKSEKGKQAVEARMSDAMSKIALIPQKELDFLVGLYNTVVEAKEILVSGLDKLSSVKTMLMTKTGLEETSPEGYVAVSKDGRDAVKLVNRLQFSRANFSDDILKGWQK